MPRAKRHTYHLQVCPGDSLQGPSDNEIASAVRGLPGGVPSFVILTKGKDQFMQAGGSVADGFQLEYQEFSRDGHWEHEDSADVSADVVIQAFQWYAQDDDRWRTELKWKRLVRSELQKRNKQEWEEWRASQPKEGFFKGLVRGLTRIAYEEVFGRKRQ